MKILHYALGLPPKRSGGLTKYVTDLMSAQSKENEVSLLYPGGTSLFSNHRYIKRKRSWNNISIFSIQNSLIVPLLYGISNPNNILNDKKKFSINNLEQFYQAMRPEIFHIHTWMGLPTEFVFFMKKKGVKIIYTSHDYYGICPKTNLIKDDGEPCHYSLCDKNCKLCNASAPSAFFLHIRNSNVILKLKNLKLVRTILR